MFEVDLSPLSPSDRLWLNSSYLRSYADRNPAKKFLVIRQESRGRGLFSLLSGVVCLLDYAEKTGLTPIVDFENFPTIYNEETAVNGTKNSFEYFFKPVSDYRLEEVYSSKNVFMSCNNYPKGYSYSVSSNPSLLPVYQKFFHPQDEVLRAADMLIESLAPESTLAVHFRGKEMRRAYRHPYPPTMKQMIAAINTMMKLDDYSHIFLSSEDPDLIEKIDRAFPSLVVINESCFRTSFGNAYKQRPREFHRYKLGLEILADMFALARCKSLISCSSNVSTFARFINGGQYKRRMKIINGYNNVIPPFHRVSWYVRNVTPAQYGGFKLDNTALTIESGI